MSVYIGSADSNGQGLSGQNVVYASNPVTNATVGLTNIAVTP